MIQICAAVGFLLHYFFLVTFLNMAAEAVDLYMKLVIVLGRNIPHYALKASIISWGKILLLSAHYFPQYNAVLPFFIVLLCFVTDYQSYTSDHL